MFRPLFRCAALITLSAAWLHPGFAQTVTGTITGLVTDTSQGIIPNATVVARNMATGTQAATVTSSTGNYVIPNLLVGYYELTVTQAGFKSWVRSNIALSSGDNVRVDTVLQVGQVSERVHVSAETPPLRTESTEVSTE